MKKFAIIVAGGSGTRMNSSLPKQFMLLKGKPVLYYTIHTFLQAFDDCNVILVLPESHLAYGKEIISTYFNSSRIQVTAGGETRFHSVKNGLKLVNVESVVFVHDAVRCLISTKLIRNCFEAAVQFGAAVPVISSKDSVRLVTGETNEALQRNRVKLVQTPQTFHSKILLPAFETEYSDAFTDEATVVEACGHKIYLLEGEESNFKITLPVDLELAEKLITG